MMEADFGAFVAGTGATVDANAAQLAAFRDREYSLAAFGPWLDQL